MATLRSLACSCWPIEWTSLATHRIAIDTALHPDRSISLMEMRKREREPGNKVSPSSLATVRDHLLPGDQGPISRKSGAFRVT